jgi:hypothetical protein
MAVDYWGTAVVAGNVLWVPTLVNGISGSVADVTFKNPDGSGTELHIATDLGVQKNEGDRPPH